MNRIHPVNRIHPATGAACAVAAALFLAAAPPTRAETHHHCSGFIDSLPAVLTTQGTWCLRKDLSTAQDAGDVITIGTNNVTIDCNGHKIGNLSATPPRNATGIRADGRSNLTVRGCSLRGFYAALYFSGGYSHLIEDNTFDGARSVGIWADGDSTIVRRNRVVDTGIDDDIGLGDTEAIVVQGDVSRVHDNTVQGVYGTDDDDVMVAGILFFGHAHWIHDNQVSGLVLGTGTGDLIGIRSNVSSQSIVERNMIVNPEGDGVGIDVYGGSQRPVCRDNHVRGFASAIPNCLDGGGNYGD